jgi:hypothetical protein
MLTVDGFGPWKPENAPDPGEREEQAAVNYQRGYPLRQCELCTNYWHRNTGKRFVPRLERLSFPKIMSGRNGGAIRTGSGWRQWHRTAGPPDPGAHPCPMPSAYGPHCSTLHKQKEFAAGAPHQRPASGPGTRGARCRSDVPHSHFARAIQARSVGRGYNDIKANQLIRS